MNHQENEISSMMNDEDEDDENVDYDDGNDDWNQFDNDVCDVEIESIDQQNRNIEHFDYQCINYEEAKNVFESIIQNITNRTQLNRSFVKTLLIQSKWDVNEILSKFFVGDGKFFETKGIKPEHKKLDEIIQTCQTNSFYLPEIVNGSEYRSIVICNVCYEKCFKNNFLSLICGHGYCRECWLNYIRVNIENGQSTNIRCMRTECQLFIPEDFVQYLLNPSHPLKHQYDRLSFRECIETHDRMKHCVNSNCETVILAQEQPAPKRVHCSNCSSYFCFQCGNDYHAPTDCKTIILWHRKCVDDSETAHYISAHTKLCPNCGSCIEKNGGCNHMSCYSCKHDFCWVCLGAWSLHGPQFYRCSKYKENVDIKNESEQAREALKKYLFYYERWDNHMKSLKFEDENLQRIKTKINDELNRNNGTWIDWQYLLRGAEILSKCRYTLQYTYPYAYYMESGPQKELFEYQQAELENEIENLAWKIENAETADRGGLENQMTIVEKRRTTLLYNFFQY